MKSELSSGFVGISSFSIPFENGISTTTTATIINTNKNNIIIDQLETPTIINDIKYFTMDQIKTHNTKDNFWAIFRNKVYDLTYFWKDHPGGDIILEAAGKDMTYLFDDIGHSFQAELLLKKYYIGEYMSIKK